MEENKKEIEIQRLLQMVIQVRMEKIKIAKEIEQLRATNQAIKIANDERIRKIQEENFQLDIELKEKESQLRIAQEKLESQIFETKNTLLRRLFLTNLKNLIKEIKPVTPPEHILFTIYANKFAVVYDGISLGSKPVNKYEWNVKVKLSDEMQRTALGSVWPDYNALHHWSGLRSYFLREFKSEKDAKAYADRNRVKVCEPLIKGLKQLENEIEAANENIDEVFDFRMITDDILDPQYSRSDKFKISSAAAHELTLLPTLDQYDREISKIRPYMITVTQKGYQLMISGHRLTREAKDINYAIYKHFSTEFKAIEADTQQEISSGLF